MFFAVGMSWKGKTSDKAKVEQVKGTIVFLFLRSSLLHLLWPVGSALGELLPAASTPGPFLPPQSQGVSVEAESRVSTSYLFVSAPEIPGYIFPGMI